MIRLKSWCRDKLQVVKDEFTSEPPKKMIKNNLFILLGALVFAFGDSFFLLPMNIVSGGTSSLAIITNAIPGADGISVQAYIVIYTWLLFALGLFTLGIKYSLKTLLFTIAYPLFVLLFNYLIGVSVVTVKGNPIHILDITEMHDILIANGTITDKESLLTMSYLMAAILGGLVIGVGIGLAFIGGGSSGGTDVFNLLLNKYFHVKVGTGSFLCDFLLIFAGFFANGFNLLASMIGILSAILCSLMIDKVFLGYNQYYVALVVSKKWSEINDYINQNFERGTTLIKAQGGFTRVDSMLLEVCFDSRDYQVIQEIITHIDPNAFVTIIRAQEIVGYGFSRDTPQVNMKDLALPPDEAQRLLLKSLRMKKKSGR
jgi:uncharacterized membrane-anchored protein YitT (DUF2179 family)